MEEMARVHCLQYHRASLVWSSNLFFKMSLGEFTGIIMECWEFGESEERTLANPMWINQGKPGYTKRTLVELQL